MDNIDQQKIMDANSIFDGGFLYSKSLYLYCFNSIPSANYIGYIDGEKAFNAVKEKFSHLIRSVHKYRYYDRQLKSYDFNETYIIMQNNCILEFDTGYCEIFHDGNQDDFINECTALMKAFKERQRRKPLEINLICKGQTGLGLKRLEVKRTKLDLDSFL
ncbi:hypothetical protein [Ferruginibacter sp.]